jgi:hypothetical protein
VLTNTINTMKTVIISTFNIINAVLLILLVQTENVSTMHY